MYKKALGLFEEFGNVAGPLQTQLSYAQFLEQRGESTASNSLKLKTLDKAKETGLYLDVS